MIRLVVVTCIVLLPSISAAQTADDEAVEEHDRRAEALYRSADYEGALDELRAAQVQSPATFRLFNIATCLQRIEEHERALEMLRRYVDASDAITTRRDEAYAAIEELEVLVLRETDASPAPIPTTFITEEERRDSAAEALPAAPRRPLRTPFFAMVGVTGALTIAMTVIGAVTLVKHSNYGQLSLLAGESLENYATRWHDEQTTGQRLSLVTDVLLGVTVASAIATLVLGLFALRRPPRNSSSQRRCIARPSPLGLSMVF